MPSGFIIAFGAGLIWPRADALAGAIGATRVSANRKERILWTSALDLIIFVNIRIFADESLVQNSYAHALASFKPECNENLINARMLHERFTTCVSTRRIARAWYACGLVGRTSGPRCRWTNTSARGPLSVCARSTPACKIGGQIEKRTTTHH
jgi:hypothetical protein